jgi:hypothetical protein
VLQSSTPAARRCGSSSGNRCEWKLEDVFMEMKLLLGEMMVQIGEVFLKINMVNGENKAAIVVDKFAATIFVFLVTGLADVVMLK